ncbi:hypothetical protein O6H91_08G072000 [Diphasiastrum complanatum]|uniref:Uncharacterized protein n=1 Tax=Diphasiastrum complanatum TaxID=34168 RepID=A0ACC2CYS2_DIPCM|nr:hypothetical protein O6H91_Y333500 [Diphasiastrum complanatum]KAJ7547151.1 hypothetical protein O6H91_08G072000 [Diphasiastrum complanatum]
MFLTYLTRSSISLSIHISLPFFPAKFKCLLFGLLSNLGEVLDVDDDFNSRFSPLVKVCILWNLADALPSLLNIFDGAGFYEQPIHFGPLPPFCQSCHSLSSCCCLGTSSSTHSPVFQIVCHKKNKKSPCKPSLSMANFSSGFGLPVLDLVVLVGWRVPPKKSAPLLVPIWTALLETIADLFLAMVLLLLKLLLLSRTVLLCFI